MKNGFKIRKECMELQCKKSSDMGEQNSEKQRVLNSGKERDIDVRGYSEKVMRMNEY